MDIGPTTACATISGNELLPLNAAMGDEIRRLETFKHWPKPHIVTAQSLAQAGFYYTNRNDIVECAFCLGKIYNWKVGDNAVEEHRRLFPNCSFIKRVANRYKCIICLENEIEVAFIPCLHMVCCEKCSENLTNCLICGEGVKSALKLRFCHDIERFPSKVEQCDCV